MAFCTSCGKEVPAGMKFCTACGASMDTGTPVVSAPAEPVRPAVQIQQPVTSAVQAPPVYADQAPPGDSRYAVVSTGGFFGTILLFSIPVIGWIICIIFACGGTKNRNKRNLARAFLIFFAIMLVLSFVLFFAFKALTDLVWQAVNDASGGSLGEFGNFGDLMDQVTKEAGGGMNDIPLS